MSSCQNNMMGPVLPATPAIQALASRPEIKHAAIHKLHMLHKNSVIHHFKEHEIDQHIANWSVVQYAEEQVAYGVNYFLKVQISPGHYLHMRLHRQQHDDIYDFYSLHQTMKHNEETCIWSLEEPLVYFNS
ncbi:hypothetical protein CEUSTIGMA_g8469.t1 [Chlamydomonas eustigma]|uniref:Cystatin domain-containing protein n=1 Tax=Chlamydomonas eustigma TaxID=1157962 RepID=A0A250XD74_9CHLO|nr:hypothetical protein CEUSTIGMA_g8469.t1 [Chlamydomonas eustigma]|eukprot:GAX81034.1 hypothetical protein CEUSTIGMA_g8469.t1 [Chlamydomonas eustigma]